MQPQPTAFSRQPDVPKGPPRATSLAYLTPKSGHHHDVPPSLGSLGAEDRQQERMAGSLARPHSAGDGQVASQYDTITQLPPRFQSSMAGRPLSAQPSLGSRPGLTVSQLQQTTSTASTQAQRVQPSFAARLHGGGSSHASQVGVGPAPISEPRSMRFTYLAVIEHLA